MKNKLIVFILCALLMICALPTSLFALKSDDIVILYENDVHCEIDGYSKLSAMKKKLQESYNYVGMVSAGDYIQGNSYGVISRGEYAVELMNLVGYDAVTLGNHEFDFRLERLEELIGKMDTKPICCNFQRIGEEESYFDPYTIVSYGDVDVAYIGITTPSTITSAAPAQFKDENGEFIYTFNSTTFYEVIQKNIDAAEAEGADYVIAVSHVGYAEDEIYGDLEDVEDLIRNTDGFDVVLDGHSHSVIEGKKIADKGGNEVLLTSTGTKFEYIGKLTVSDDGMTSELIKMSDITETDPVVDAYLQQIDEEYLILAERKVAESTVDLLFKDADGNRLVRRSETNLGDLCAESFRYAVDADIGYINGGAIRTDILKGDITYKDMLNVLPFNNTVVKGEVSGQVIRDMMEMAMIIWPDENGSFPHISGLTFSVNTAIESSVMLSENEEFIGVSGEYRVYDLKVYNRESGEYEPLDLTKTYTLAASNFILLERGSGMKMLENAKIVQDDGILDVETLERYISEMLDGVVGEEYSSVETSITFTDGYVSDSDDNESDDNESDNEGDNGASGDSDNNSDNAGNSGNNASDSGNSGSNGGTSGGADDAEPGDKHSPVVIVAIVGGAVVILIVLVGLAEKKAHVNGGKNASKK